ncbi:caspase family protein [Candidatus Marithrix sp. Canyon 246]|uniref:caspase family protein n=2 Tax=Candidatus Marithrix sp. Canyon 246 TaxID=1827136 RepID=UPI00084A1896|nr:caspase family protein [Candidatus Marithrix sp. Canyon 246]
MISNNRMIYFLVALLVSACSNHATNFTEQDTKKNPQQALVIGNGEYEYSPLSNPINDAKDMADRLRQMGFSVTLKTNLNHKAMVKDIREFGQRLSATQTPESVGLFYFAGHGTQVNEQNFLLPINNNSIKNKEDFEQNAVHTKIVLDEMTAANKGMNIVILDACYENPYQNSNVKNPIPCFAAPLSPPRGVLIAFARGKVKKSNSLYTKNLLQVLKHSEHIRIEDVFMNVHQRVIQESAGQQTPWYQASLRKPFCFGGCSNE